MNLRRIVKGIVAACLVVFFAADTNAQAAQLAGVSQDGLIQLGSNHPFVVSTYEIDIAPYGLSTTNEAVAFFRKYIEEGFNITFDLVNEKAILNINIRDMYDVNSVPVAEFNKKLRDVHTISR